VQQPAAPATPQQILQGVHVFQRQLRVIQQGYGQIANIEQAIRNNPQNPQNHQLAQNLIQLINALQPQINVARATLQQLWPAIQQMPQDIRQWLEQGIVLFLAIEADIAYFLIMARGVP